MSHPVRAKKHLGQHFLKDENVAHRIVEALLEKDKDHPVVEVGPGTGVLTQFLVKQPLFFALDVDAESVEYLKTKYPARADNILLADFLDADLEKIAGEKFNVIGNFPYNISSQIMFKVLENRNHVDFVVGMFQKEVAARLAEGPGSKVYGILSVLLQAFFNIEYLFTVDRTLFDPPPKVQSAVIRLSRNSVQSLECDEALFKKVVKTAFNQRRKTIRNSIRALFNNNDIRHPLLDKRPEQLSVAQFVELTQLVAINSAK
jgi:16S rRNA (adenine1518-N6/adenine1519-N6)-dimethyltransferase